MKHLLKNAKIYDGTGSAPFHGDILLEDDRIVAVGTMENPEADMVTDLEGRSVSSGFIDGHSHNDWFAIKKDPLPYFEPFIRQGTTSFVTGNCGVSATGFGILLCGRSEHALQHDHADRALLSPCRRRRN